MPPTPGEDAGAATADGPSREAGLSRPPLAPGEPTAAAERRDPVRAVQPAAGPDGRPGRHCWVSLPVDGPHPSPGLLVEWRRGERGRWEGRVVYVAQLRPGRWSVVEEWVASELLTAP